MGAKITLSDYAMRAAPLWWHDAGKTQTASGYGSKLTTPWKVWHRGRWRRLYACCWSNSASYFVVIKGEQVWIACHLLQYPD